MNMGAAKAYATQLLTIALDMDLFYQYLLCIEPFVVSLREPNGGCVEPHTFQLEVVYDHHRAHPELGLDKKVFDTLDDWTRKVKGIYAFTIILDLIEYHMFAERGGTTPFSMDNEALLTNIRQNLADNSELYHSEIYQQRCFMAKMKVYDERLAHNFGIHVL